MRGPRAARRPRPYRSLLRAACQIGGSDATEPPVAGVWSGSESTHSRVGDSRQAPSGKTGHTRMWNDRHMADVRG
jgi:hypothetical protein